MKNLLFAAVLAVFMLGCASTKSMNEAQKKELLAYTSKFEKENFLVVGTYLNPIYPQGDDQNDDFIISIYPDDNNIDVSTLKINGDDEGVSAYMLSDDEPILGKLAFRTPWAKHYKISVSAKNAEVLILEFGTTGESGRSHQVALSFQKISRSLYWSPR